MLMTDQRTPESTRRSKSLRAHFSVILIWQDGERREQETTHTVSVSRFGCRVRCRCSLRPGTAVRLEHGERVMLGNVSGSLTDYVTQLTELGIGIEKDSSEFWGISFED
jgi:hypothetical protein